MNLTTSLFSECLYSILKWIHFHIILRIDGYSSYSIFTAVTFKVSACGDGHRITGIMNVRNRAANLNKHCIAQPTWHLGATVVLAQVADILHGRTEARRYSSINWKCSNSELMYIIVCNWWENKCMCMKLHVATVMGVCVDTGECSVNLVWWWT